MRALLAIAVVALAARASAAPLVIVVRGGGEPLAVARLRGQLADLDVRVAVEPGAIEPALDRQLATAARLADADEARAVVWFVARDGGLAVAIATPADRRLFVREIPAADASAVAEAAAVAARGAIRAIADGGTIGVEVPPPAPRFVVEIAVGWQVALDAGAGAGAQALVERTYLVRGPWAASLALSLGPALRDEAAPDVALALSRSSAAVGFERRLGGFAVGASAGALVYHRATVATSSGLAATPDALTAAFVVGPELGWRWRRGGVGIDVSLGVDVVAGAPELAVTRGDTVDSLARLRGVQPRFALYVVGLP